FAKATRVLRIFRGEDKSRLNSSVFPSAAASTCVLGGFISIVLGFQAGELLQRSAKFRVVGFHTIVQVNFELLRSQRVEGISLGGVHLGNNLADFLSFLESLGFIALAGRGTAAPGFQVV